MVRNIDGILIVDLDEICNQNCLFCFKRNHGKNVHPSIEKLKDEFKTIYEKSSNVNTIDLFGGEFSAYKHFFEFLEFLKSFNKKVSIATNMVKFGDDDFFNEFKKITKNMQIAFRISFLGHTKEIHEHYTRTPGSYEQSLKGLKNIVSITKDVRVNTVILPLNYLHLDELATLLYDNGVRKFKYGFPVDIPATVPENVYVNIKEIKSILIPVINKLRRLNCDVSIEKFPYCVAPEFESIFLQEKRKQYSRYCQFCKLYNTCPGVSIEYLNKFGDEGISIIAKQ